MDRIWRCTVKDRLNYSPLKMLAYISEELGECYSVALIDAGAKNKPKAEEPLKSELVDVLLSTYANLSALGVSQAEIQELMEKKVTKWENNQK